MLLAILRRIGLKNAALGVAFALLGGAALYGHCGRTVALRKLEEATEEHRVERIASQERENTALQKAAAANARADAAEEAALAIPLPEAPAELPPETPQEPARAPLAEDVIAHTPPEAAARIAVLEAENAALREENAGLRLFARGWHERALALEARETHFRNALADARAAGEAFAQAAAEARAQAASAEELMLRWRTAAENPPRDWIAVGPTVGFGRSLNADAFGQKGYYGFAGVAVTLNVW